MIFKIYSLNWILSTNEAQKFIESLKLFISGLTRGYEYRESNFDKYGFHCGGGA